MKERDVKLKQYYRSIQSCLVCDPALKRKILAQIKQNVDAFLAEAPDADFSAIEQHFGTPQQIAAAHVEEMETPQLLQKLRVRKRIITIVAVAAVIMIAMWAVVVGYAMVDAHNSERGYYETYITRD